MRKKRVKPIEEIDHTGEYKPGQRHLNLTKAERTDLAAHEKIEHAVAMFLDLEQSRTWAQIADELGVTVSALKRITKEPEFQKVYDEVTNTLGHDPRLRAVSTALPDLLPLAFRTMRELLTSDNDTVRLNAVKEVFKLNQIGSDYVGDDPRELTNFLSSHGVKIEGDVVVALGIPPEFQDAFRKFLGTDTDGLRAGGRDVVDGVVIRTEDSAKDTTVEDTEKTPVSEPPVLEAETGSDQP